MIRKGWGWDMGEAGGSALFGAVSFRRIGGYARYQAILYRYYSNPLPVYRHSPESYVAQSTVVARSQQGKNPFHLCEKYACTFYVHTHLRANRGTKADRQKASLLSPPHHHHRACKALQPTLMATASSAHVSPSIRETPSPRA